MITIPYVFVPGTVIDETQMNTNLAAIAGEGLDNVTLATLPTPAVAGIGTRGYIHDSTVQPNGNFGAVVAGGGIYGVPVYSDGTVWRIG